MDKKRSDRFKRWMIASFFLIPLVLFGTTLSYYYLYTPVKMRVLIFLLRYDKTDDWVWKRIYHNEGQRAVPYVIKGLKDKNPKVRAWSAVIVKGLAMLRGIHDESLMARLVAPERGLDSPGLSGRVATALGRIGQKRVLPALVKLLSEPEDLVRYSEVVAFATFAEKESVPFLIKLLGDSDIGLRKVAALALGWIGSNEALRPLIAALKEQPMPGVKVDEWGDFQSFVMYAIAELTGQSFGDVWSASDAERDAIIQKWLNWWEENKEKYEKGG